MNGEERTWVERVNINTASVEELSDRLVGIASALARRIVEYRELHGPFESVESLRRVRGIGGLVLERNADRLTVESVLPAADRRAEAQADIGAEAAFAIEETEAPTEEAPAPESAVSERSPMGEREPSLAREDMSRSEMVEVETVARVDAPAGTATSGPASKRGRPRASEGEPEALRRSEEHWWRNVLLVILGGLLGALLTLALVVAWSGTLSFAPRSQLDALSRNVRTMQENSELAWDRLDRARAAISELDAQVSSLQAMGRRVESLQADLALAQGDLDQLDVDLRSLRSEANRRLGDLDDRVDQSEAGIQELDTELGRVQQTVQTLDSRVQRFDIFLRSLRDLLVSLDGGPSPAMQDSSATGQTPAPEVTPQATLAATPQVTPTAAP